MSTTTHQYGTFTDERKDATNQSHTYKTIKLKDNNIWLAENFNFAMSLDKTLDCYGGYEIEPQRRDAFQLFYTWAGIHEAMPDGWRLPTVDEWNNLIELYGGPQVAYTALLEGGDSGLNLKLGGYRAGKHYINSQIGEYCRYWSGTIGNDNNSGALVELKKEDRSASILWLMFGTYYFNIRLIKIN